MTLASRKVSIIGACCLLASATVSAQSQPSPKESGLAASAVVQADAAQYTVQSGDTLLGIAKDFNRDGFHAAQYAIALYSGNPHAFVNGNINNIKLGAKLDLPQDQQWKQVAVREVEALLISLGLKTHQSAPAREDIEVKRILVAEEPEVIQDSPASVAALVSQKDAVATKKLTAMLREKNRQLAFRDQYIKSLEKDIKRWEQDQAAIENVLAHSTSATSPVMGVTGHSGDVGTQGTAAKSTNLFSPLNTSLERMGVDTNDLFKQSTMIYGGIFLLFIWSQRVLFRFGRRKAWEHHYLNQFQQVYRRWKIRWKVYQAELNRSKESVSETVAEEIEKPLPEELYGSDDDYLRGNRAMSWH